MSQPAHDSTTNPCTVRRQKCQEPATSAQHARSTGERTSRHKTPAPDTHARSQHDAQAASRCAHRGCGRQGVPAFTSRESECRQSSRSRVPNVATPAECTKGTLQDTGSTLVSPWPTSTTSPSPSNPLPYNASCGDGKRHTDAAPSRWTNTCPRGVCAHVRTARGARPGRSLGGGALVAHCTRPSPGCTHLDKSLPGLGGLHEALAHENVAAAGCAHEETRKNVAQHQLHPLLVRQRAVPRSMQRVPVDDVPRRRLPGKSHLRRWDSSAQG